MYLLSCSSLVKTYILTGDLPKFEANTKVAAKI